ncbi:imidazole glycerol phosphate synthase subunit HisH [Flexivirga endophytica]|uniref:Imidazole glycerol phosphate synthase subunit HisH n=1 Tax=Flexivirga endophytica TaxID=1849103 RepID=A0A916THA2_9MICO|nr:imidazole glycerol phosphate synthase subunit HisH [Flexivirga endophytica]GGB42117.1 imidazole glycerol phosphate synthase subunit HisH [Flexivirga endophytica]GHB69227.1 imidazole glycerol phosphate synthase subunit HisH [Flexivirga endophytica]
MSKHVVVLDYGSGNVRSVVRMLERVGAQVTLTADRQAAVRADGLYVPGVGAFHACMTGLRTAGGAEIIADRLRLGRPVLGVCVGFQVLFDGSTEPTSIQPPPPGLGHFAGIVERLDAPVVPHMGWSNVTPAPGSRLFDGVRDERFYFVHSYAARRLDASRIGGEPVVTTAEHGTSFVAAIEDGALAGTQFHPEKSGDAGAQLVDNWLRTL